MAELNGKLSREMQEELMQRSEFVGLLDQNQRVLYYLPMSAFGNLHGVTSLHLTLDLGQPEAVTIRKNGLFSPNELLDPGLVERVTNKVNLRNISAAWVTKVLQQAQEELQNG